MLLQKDNAFKLELFLVCMITYNDLYEALRKERYSEELQVLPKKFISEVAEYFNEKKNANEPKDDFFSDATIKSKKKLENAIGIFKELLLRRKKKILNLAFVASETGISKRDFENMLPFEKELFESTVKALEKTEQSLSEGMAGEKIENNFLLVRFLDSVGTFLNMEGDEIGPFEKGEVANMDKEIAEILEKDGKIEVLEED
jgi:DNA replication initiation complex subunit (GINS family)